MSDFAYVLPFLSHISRLAKVPRRSLDLDDFIKRLEDSDTKRGSRLITEDEILQLCDTAIESFNTQDVLLKIKSPITICGDIHGQYLDLLKLFKLGGDPSSTRYLFLGDYVDRGKNSLETISLLLALKSRHPRSFFLLRGNHECAPINRIFGFFAEIKRRFRCGNFMRVYLKLNEVFNYMPIAAVVDRSVFCCHGGLSPELKSLNCIASLERPLPPRKSGLVTDILWSDPDETIENWEEQNRPEVNPKHRGLGFLWGSTAHCNFLRRHRLKLLIRAHECVGKGYHWMFDKQLVTVFSAPNYSDNNHAAIATYHEDGSLTFTTFK